MNKPLLSILAALLLAGCGDPLDRVDKLSDVELADTEPRRDLLAQADPGPGPERAGFLSRILQRASADADVVADDGSADADAEALQPEALPAVTADVQDAPPRRRGLWSRLRGTDDTLAHPASDAVTKEDTQIASLSPTPETARPLLAIRGLFGSRTHSGTGSEPDVTPGQPLPFGQVARACGATKQDMGQRIEKAAHGFALYDSQPGATGPRNFFVTGFSDGCPRQFTAALAIFGAPSMHEKLRYGRPSEKYPYSDTDKAYEKVKSRVCGVSRRQPCGSKISRLERNTVFISTYERFTDNGRWADILVHDGAVLAASLKDL